MKTCPTCQQTYPNQTESCPRDGSRLAAEFRKERECPYCAGRIPRNAPLCKHCGHDVEPLTKSDTETPSPAQQQRLTELPIAQAQGSEPAGGALFSGAAASAPPAAARPARHKVAIGNLLLDLFLLGFIAFGCMSYFSQSDRASAMRVDTPATQSAAVPQGTQSIPHVVKSGESLAAIVSHYFSESVYMRRAELEAAIRQANSLSGKPVKPGTQIMIPGIPLQPVLDKPVPTPKDFVARGIYLTAYTAGSGSGLDLIEHWKEAGGNAVVFDIKDFDGELHTPFQHVYAPTPDITIRNLPKFIHYLHSLHMHAIARIALFRDEHLAATYPELAVHSRKFNKPWLENGKLVWADPSNRAVQDYDLDLARLAASAGADEIQFDYVRFPAEGDQADAQFAFQKDHPDWPRSKVITDFVARATDTLHPMGVLVSLDVFGVMAWAKKVDLVLTGQNIHDLSGHCDIISPMIYPSHFFGFDGYTDPGDAPEHFISESMQRFEHATAGSGVVLRPWLQAFGWRTKTYSPTYIVTQVRVAHQEGSVGFLFWNARNDYSKPFAAMPEVNLVAEHSVSPGGAGGRLNPPTTRASR